MKVVPAKRSALPPPVAKQESRKAVAVDPEIKISNLKRLRRIEGQIRGLQKMVEEERYCADIVIQISSVQEALRGVGRSLMRNHLHHCATEAIRSGSKQQVSEQYEELLELIYKHLR
ncbi:MAG TPA: metal-sensitive transcriptional regulator [Bryobacteraceae bacterium]|jgi:DNA-binding FrmR family transcriptional regulator|nr:metal-sensitive transcriptional regulator [Bryobacteraceae bacterium]